MQHKLNIKLSPTRLKQIEKIAFLGSKAKFQILNGKLEEGFHLLKSTAKKLKSFTTDLIGDISSPLATRISLGLVSHFDRKNSERLGTPKGIFLGGMLALMCSFPAVGQTTNAANTTQLISQINAANINPAAGIIHLEQGTVYILTGTNLPIVTGTDIGGTLQIICTGSSNAIISGNNANRPLTMDVNSDLSISKITIQNGKVTTGNGGGIYNNRGNLTISSSSITGNYALMGGGIYSINGNMAISNSSITGNNSIRGGGIYTYKGNMTISNSSITGNTTQTGGGIYNKATTSLIENSSVSFNDGGIFGGGITNNGNLTIVSSSISGNSSVAGGGIRTSGNLIISYSSISGNTCDVYGGGIYNTGAITISSSSISGNTSNEQGGGVFSSHSMTIQASSITTNQSTIEQGGGIYIRANSSNLTTNIINTTISNNEASTATGGGIYAKSTGATNTLTLQHVTISNNSGTVTGGFANDPSSTLDITLQNTIIANSIGADFDLGGATINGSSTNNIIEDASLVHASVTAVDPLLGALTLNSGFLIHPLQTSSTAIGTGANIGIATDQVGNPRVLTNPAIGAVEITTASLVCMVVSAPTGVSNTWIGCTNSDWGVASNWSAGSVPTVSDVVYVPAVAANQLVIDEIVTCAKMIVQIGANCKIDYNAGGKLLIKF